MKTIYIIIFLITNTITANCQVTNDTAYMRIAKKVFTEKLASLMDYSKRNRRYKVRMSYADTSNIKYILPIYNIPITYKDSINEKSILVDMVNFNLSDPKNQVFIVDNNICIWTGRSERGFSEEWLKNNPEYPYKESYLSLSDQMLTMFYVEKITNYKKFVELQSQHPTWSFFIINIFDGIWAFDEQHVLNHIYQKKKQIMIEDGQQYFEKLIVEKGLDTIKKRIDM